MQWRDAVETVAEEYRAKAQRGMGFVASAEHGPFSQYRVTRESAEGALWIAWGEAAGRWHLLFGGLRFPSRDLGIACVEAMVRSSSVRALLTVADWLSTSATRLRVFAVEAVRRGLLGRMHVQ